MSTSIQRAWEESTLAAHYADQNAADDISDEAASQRELLETQTFGAVMGALSGRRLALLDQFLADLSEELARLAIERRHEARDVASYVEDY